MNHPAQDYVVVCDPLSTAVAPYTALRIHNDTVRVVWAAAPALAAAIGSAVADYRKSGWLSRWDVTPAGLLVQPRVLTAGGLTALVVGVLRWPEATGFVVLQQEPLLGDWESALYVGALTPQSAASCRGEALACLSRLPLGDPCPAVPCTDFRTTWCAPCRTGAPEPRWCTSAAVCTAS